MIGHQDHQRGKTQWLPSVALLMLSFCVVLEDTGHLLSIVPYLLAVALIIGRIYLFGNQEHAVRTFAHGRLQCRDMAAIHAPEVVISTIDADTFYNFTNGQVIGEAAKPGSRL
jgi:hypothetical protein